MAKKRDYITELKNKSRLDKATKLTINDIDIDEIDKVNRDQRCNFFCNCGKKGNKKVRMILENSGFYCDICTNINRNKNLVLGKSQFSSVIEDPEMEQ